MNHDTVRHVFSVHYHSCIIHHGTWRLACSKYHSCFKAGNSLYPKANKALRKVTPEHEKKLERRTRSPYSTPRSAGIRNSFRDVTRGSRDPMKSYAADMRTPDWPRGHAPSPAAHRRHSHPPDEVQEHQLMHASLPVARPGRSSAFTFSMVCTRRSLRLERVRPCARGGYHLLGSPFATQRLSGRESFEKVREGSRRLPSTASAPGGVAHAASGSYTDRLLK
jgi:hypothetical protein